MSNQSILFFVSAAVFVCKRFLTIKLHTPSAFMHSILRRGAMDSITAIALKQKMDNGEDLQLIDVREPWEHDEFNISGELIPLNEIGQQVERIATDKPVILYCRKGIRSQVAIQRLQEKFPFTNLFNLIGGTEAWKKEFGDNSQESGVKG